MDLAECRLLRASKLRRAESWDVGVVVAAQLHVGKCTASKEGLRSTTQPGKRRSVPSILWFQNLVFEMPQPDEWESRFSPRLHTFGPSAGRDLTLGP